MISVWLVNPYGPIEGENWREYSFNQFGKYLSQNGCKVIWWTSSFSHHFKKQRCEGWSDVIVNDHFIIRLVPTTGYKKNMGFGRIWKDIVYARRAEKRFKSEQKPDVILGDGSILTFGHPAYTYAKQNGVPIIYDQMDIWPEFMINMLPKTLQKVGNIAVKPVIKRRKTIYDNLSGSIALGRNYLDFMFAISPGLKDKPHALVYNGIDVDAFRKHLSDETTILSSQEKKPGEIWCIFAGTLGPSYDLDSIVKVAEWFEKTANRKFKFFIAGSGPSENMIIEAQCRLPNLVYLGKLFPEELIPIYGKCDIGLSAYSSGSNVDMCDKFYDYTAAGLAIVNSLTGEVATHIRGKKLGENYLAGSAEALKDAMLKFTDPEYLETTKASSYETGSYFDMKKQNEKLLEVIKQVLVGENA